VDDLDLGRYLYLIRRWLWLVVLCAVLAGAAAYVVSSYMQPVYEARTTLLLEQSGDPFASWVMRNAQWEPATYAELIPQILPETAVQLGLDGIDVASVSVDTRPETRVVTLRVRDKDPQRATSIANTIPEVFAGYSESTTGRAISLRLFGSASKLRPLGCSPSRG
jgi:capsular polysaccharide biosynthesis protein